MAVPSEATFSVDALSDAHQALIDLIDLGSTYGEIRIRDSSDVLLATILLDDPCGTINGTTGQLTLSITGPDTSADATGTAAYADITDSDGNIHLALPTQSGGSPVSGYLVMNTLNIVSGTEVEILSATIG